MIRPLQIEVDPDDPYNNDRLNRREAVRGFSSLISVLESPAVFAVDGRWGSGKTTFLKMLVAELADLPVKTIYFNAWECDFTSDPLVAFLGEISEPLEALIDNDEERREAWNAAREVSKKIVRNSIPALVKAATYGLIDLPEQYEALVADAMGGISDDLVEDYRQSKSSVAQFRSLIERALETTQSSEPKIMIMVDELDRCRPDFAVQLLERIKHFFGISGLSFVVAIDREQLCHSVQSIYGPSFNSAEYLQRFFDVSYRLPTASVDDFIGGLFSSFGLEGRFRLRREMHQLFRHEEEHCKRSIKLLVDCWGLSLRQIEQLVAELSLVLRMGAQGEYLYPPVTIFLLYLRLHQPQVYEGYRESGRDPTVILSLLDSKFGDFANRPKELASLEGGLLGSYSNSSHEQAMSALTHYQTLSDNETTPDKVREYCRHVRACAAEPIGSDFRHRNPTDLSHVMSKIELLSQINNDL